MPSCLLYSDRQPLQGTDFRGSCFCAETPIKGLPEPSCPGHGHKHGHACPFTGSSCSDKTGCSRPSVGGGGKDCCWKTRGAPSWSSCSVCHMAEQPQTAAPFPAVRCAREPGGGWGEPWKGCQHCHLPAVRTWSLHLSAGELHGQYGWPGNSPA